MRKLWWLLILIPLGFLLGRLTAAPVRPSEDVNYLNITYAREIHQNALLIPSPVPEWDTLWIPWNEDWVAAYTAVLEGTDDAPNIREKWEAGYYVR